MISSNVEDIKYINSQSSCFSASQKAVILPQTIASQKSLAARLSEGRACHISHKTTRISRECPKDFLRPENIFDKRYSKVKMIHRSK